MKARTLTIRQAAGLAVRGLMSLLGATWTTVSTWAAAYASTDLSRKEVFNNWRPFTLTANQALAGNLTRLVAQCRHLERTTPLGRAVCEGLAADIVGTGIDVLPNSGDENLDPKLYLGWTDWAEHALVDGRSLWEWQNSIPRELCTAGAGLARLVLDPERIKKGWLPLAILPLEIEWLAENPVGPLLPGAHFVRGKELDILGRPLRYHLRHPEAPLGAPGEIVDASQIVDCYERRREQQAHGEPLLAPVVERILQDSRLIETELKAAVNTASLSIFIGSEAGGGMDGNETDDDGDAITNIPAGAVVRGLPGETVTGLPNPRPSQLIAPFRDTLRQDVAAATRVSLHWLTRDFGHTTFMNARTEMLQNKRCHVGLKELVGRDCAGRIYEALFPWLLLSLGVVMPAVAADRARLMRYMLRPDQPEYVDPTKDVAASINAIAQNLSTYDIELSSRGKNFREVFKQRSLENKLLAEMGLPLPAPVKNASSPADQAGGEDDKDPEYQAQSDAKTEAA